MTRFDILYETFVVRTTVESLNAERAAQIRLLNSNSAYLESKEGINLLDERVKEIDQKFQDAIDMVRDPLKYERRMEKIRKDPMLSASLRGLDNLKWKLAAGEGVA